MLGRWIETVAGNYVSVAHVEAIEWLPGGDRAVLLTPDGRRVAEVTREAVRRALGGDYRRHDAGPEA